MELLKVIWLIWKKLLLIWKFIKLDPLIINNCKIELLDWKLNLNKLSKRKFNIYKDKKT
jgi:hypothetical protein